MKGNLTAEALRSKQLLTSFGFVLLVAPVAVPDRAQAETEWKRVLVIAAWPARPLVLRVLPFSSEQNPPINWGYPARWRASSTPLAAASREDRPVANFKHRDAPRAFPGHAEPIISTRRIHVGRRPVHLVHLDPRAGGHPFYLRPTCGRHWVMTSLICFLSLTVLFIVSSTAARRADPVHRPRAVHPGPRIFALWIAYGLIFLLACWRRSSGARRHEPGGVARPSSCPRAGAPERLRREVRQDRRRRGAERA